MENPLLVLAGAADRWRSAQLSPELEAAARRAILDWFATTLPGSREEASLALLRAVQLEDTPGRSICYADDATRSPRAAALLNATASHIVEFDDIFRDGGYHPGSSTIAAALALAQHLNRPLADLHRAIIGGYEVGCRISLAVQPSHYVFWHTTATIGTMGAATACAILLGCDADKIAHAISIASSFAGGHQQNLKNGGMAKALHAGHAADAGMLAAFAASSGMTGSPDALHGKTGYAAATSASTGDWVSALKGLGEWTPIEHMTIKNHGCCGHIFPALDGLRLLRQQHGFTWRDISSIRLDGYDATKSMCDRPNPQNASDARFGAQYCICAGMVLGAVRLNAFEDVALSHPDIRALMAKVTVGVDPALASLYPKQRMAKLAVQLTDGRSFDHLQETRKGDPEDPLSMEELVQKFDELAGAVLPEPQIAALRTRILASSELPQQAGFFAQPNVGQG
ncbi:MmgE/PrpD family protein [Rhizobium skierniewicense]|uniref:MmgE/PrpD family protein n=1 Tax=Rhizobium skierniewicense TaxID=984260 RepID=UPI001FAD1842|nr:MmgE/PrpD family protein [Rhizobium skierniewicense]MCI9867257.1 MmgE/PrpD family protein [Rhizobium skierniewicense]